jgi:hypothetical protein
MITFVGGVGFTELLKYMGRGGKQSFATYDNGEKITSTDITAARQELEILRALRGDVFLFYKTTADGTPDVNTQLLGYLLFGDTQIGAKIRNQLCQYAQRGKIAATIDQIDEFFNQEQERPETMWILLCAESRKAGIAVSNAQSAVLLRGLIPQMTGNRSDAATEIHRVTAQMNLTDTQILSAFGRLLGILKWADQVCNNENMTLAQIRAAIGRSKEKMDIDSVKFAAEWFMDQQAEPTAEQIQSQFDAYKNFPPGQFSDQNPCGFGYQLAPRVQLEYFYVRNDDIKKRIEKPVAEAMEEYYSANIAQFRTSHPKDPNKPEGETITETQSFAEVSDQIYQILEQERSGKLTQLIFKDARDMLDTELIHLDMEKAPAEQIRKAAVDFGTVAAKITEKYNVPVHTGKTGILSPADFGADNCLSGLRISHSGVQTPLSEAVFAIDAQNAVVPRKVGVYIPRMWENIGSMTGGFYSEKESAYTSITVICRVIDVRKSEIPADLNITYSTAGIVSSDTENEKKVFNIKQQVVNDIRKASAMKNAKAAAEEFRHLIAKTNWDKAVEQYNSQYAPKDPNKVDIKAFRKLTVDSLKQQVLASESDIDQIHRIMHDNPVSAGFLQTRLVANILNRKFFSLPNEKPQAGTLPELVEFQPGSAWYVVKNITRKAVTTEEYLQNKPYAAMRVTLDDASRLGLIHFSPKQVHKRMNYKPLKDKTSASKTENPVEG